MMRNTILISDGWTIEPPTKPGKYWFFGDAMMGGMGVDYTDKAECILETHLVTVWTASNGLVGVCNGNFINLKRFDKNGRHEGHVGWWKTAEMPNLPTNYEEAFDGFLIKLG